eukprot:CFRG6448T1
MHYLDDYLETVETLPEDLSHNCTRMREMDLKVQNMLDSIQTKVATNLKNKKIGSKDTPKAIKAQKDREVMMGLILTNYDEGVLLSEEKLNLANETYSLVARHKQRLDNEIKKFTIDLEAKQPGVTALAEQRSRKLDSQATNNLQNAVSSLTNRIKKRGSSMEPVANNKKKHLDITVGGIGGQTPVGGGSTTTGRRGQRVGTTALPVQGVLTVPVPEFKEPEQLYCICNQGSYGDMVGCDNEGRCLKEWFHYTCVGLTEAPKGKWYCPDCRVTMKRRGKL